MALENIEYGSLASSEMMNNNFEYLDNRISNLADTQTSNTSSIYSAIAGINSVMSQQNESFTISLDNLEDLYEAIRNDFDSQNNAPDYSREIGITLPYTVTQNGYIYGGADGVDVVQYVYVNGKIVHGHCGYSGGKWVYSGSLFRVSTGDVVTCSRISGSYIFYPMKGNFIEQVSA